MDAFDADVLIYAATSAHPLGSRVAALFPPGGDSETAGIGSVLLLPELLTRPTRDDSQDELAALYGLLSRLDLRPVDPLVAELAVVLGAAYRLKAADAVHLATAVNAGADRFITNNARDFKRAVDEIDVTYPDDLPAPPSRRSYR
ncbi:MAG TPA: PIN domain-containing protein [Acidimicrobiales bacterium]|nr:PIN domain-containing protein [Acidimicrobiales bacterium]